jgi:hypothetical protein
VTVPGHGDLTLEGISELPTQGERDFAFRYAVWQMFGYETFEAEVDRFHQSKARTKIASSPARTAKSYSGWKDVLPDILIHGMHFAGGVDVSTQIGWIVAPNYVLAKEFDYAWEDLVERGPKLGFGYKIERKANNANQGDMTIVINWGDDAEGRAVKDIVVVKSATNINVLQAEEVDWAILSEAARLPQLVWTKFLSTRVKRSVWPTTPDIEAAWIWDEIQKSGDPRLGIDTFNFTGRANPTYDWERYWIEHMKTEESEVGEIKTIPQDKDKCPSQDNGHDCFEETTDCSAMKEDGFAEQFGGKWVFHRGRVVPLREKRSANGQPAHVFEEDLDWFNWADLHVSFDYGYSDGTCIGFWFVGASQVVLYDSIYETEMTPDDVVDAVERKVAEIAKRFHRDQSSLVRRFVGDPQQPAVAEVFRRRGVPIWDVDKEAQRSRKAGHLELMNYLKTDPVTGEPGMLVHRRNREVIKEWSKLRRNDRVKEDAPSSLIGRDHAYDMARYFVMTRPVSRDLPSRKQLSEFERARQRILGREKQKRIATVNRQYGKSRVGGLRA